MRPRRSLALASVAAAAALVLSACASGTAGAPAPSSGSATGSSAGADWQPVTVDHAFGSTSIPVRPERVVTLGWGSTEAALALGVVPVGIEKQTYAVDENGVLPWVNARLDELGATPTLLPATVEEPAYEDIAALSPDLILAPYSGVTAEQYALLAQIAPTVVYPKAAWTTPWREVITLVGASLGLAAQADDLVASLDATVAAAAAAHPELAGRSVAAVWDTAGTFYVYRPDDSRVAFLLDLGLVGAPSVDELASGSASTFFFTLSYEQTDRLDADLVVAYASTQADADAFLAQPYAQAIPAVARGAVAMIVGDQLISAMSPPTALSLTWGLDDYLSALAAAATHTS